MNVYDTILFEQCGSSIQLPIFYTFLHRLRLSVGHQKWSLVIRFVNIVDIMLWPLPKFRDHFIEERRLRCIDENVLTQSTLAITLFSVHFLVTATPSTNPSAPVQPIKSCHHTFHGFTFSLSQRELCDRSDRLTSVQYIWTVSDLQALQANCQIVDGSTRRWG